MKNLRIVVADDHAVICQCVKSLFNAQPNMQVVGTALRGEDAYQLVGKLKPDIVVMDLMMPGLGGAATTKRIQELYPQTKVVVFSGYDDEIYVQQAYKNGAVAYILKSSEIKEVIHALRVVTEGGIYISPHLAHKIIKKNIDGENNSLSEREKDILRLTASGLSNKEIASLLVASVKTIEAYKTRINKKMNFGSRFDLVRYAMTQGLLKNETDTV